MNDIICKNNLLKTGDFNKYEQIRCISESYESKILKVHSDGNIFAMKIFSRKNDSYYISKFQNAIEKWCKLQNKYPDYVVHILDYGTDPSPWYVMEYAELDFKTALTKNLTSLYDICTLLNILSVFHNENIFIGAILPEKILKINNTWRFSDLFSYVPDDGYYDSSEICRISKYCAPEILSSNYGPVDKQSDLWSIGILLHVLFTKKLPYRDLNNVVGLISEIINNGPDLKTVPSQYEEILSKALSMDKKNRYPNALDFYHDLIGSLSNTIEYANVFDLIKYLTDMGTLKGCVKKTDCSNSNNYKLIDISLLESLANCDFVEAQKIMGDIYLNGEYVSQSYESAAKWYKLAAKNGNTEAQCNLGWLFEKGLGVEKSEDLAFALYSEASKHGNPVAENNLGLMYEKGVAVQKSYGKAFTFFTMSAIQDNASAQNNIAIMFKNGWGVEQSYTDAITWFKRSAENNYDVAQYNLAVMYLNGWGVEKSYSLSMDWLLKAAKQNNSIAQYNLGIFYEKGIGIETDIDLALVWFKKSAASGYVPALNKVNSVNKNTSTVTKESAANVCPDYSNFDNDLISKHIEVKIPHVIQNSDMYHKDEQLTNAKLSSSSSNEIDDFENLVAEDIISEYKVGDSWNYEAIYNRGLKLENDSSTTENEFDYTKICLKLFEFSAENGNADAAYHLGEMYESGKNVVRSLSRAIQYFKISAEAGNAIAQFKLAENIEEGNLLPQYDDESYDLYEKSAMRGYIPAMRKVAKICSDITSPHCSTSFSVELYNKAAQHGDAESQLRTGLNYKNGCGVQRSDQTARSYFEKAANNGNAEACYYLGLYYEYGLSVNTDEDVAKMYFSKSKEYGYVPYYDNIFEILENSDMSDLENNPEVKIYDEFCRYIINNKLIPVCDNQSISAEALKYYREGMEYISIPKKARIRYPKAVEAFKKSYELGNISAAREIGDCYMAISEISSSEKGLKYYKIAADHGVNEAQFELGRCYSDGRGIHKSMPDAMKYYMLAAKQGNKKALYNLGLIFMNYGYAHAKIWAITCFKAAYEHGLDEAKTKLFNLDASILWIREF